MNPKLKQRLHANVRVLQIIAISLSVGSCKQTSNMEGQVKKEIPQGAVNVKWELVNANAIAKGHSDGTRQQLGCEISVKGTLNGKPFEKTVSASATADVCKCSDFILRCGDPVAFQFPADAHAFVGRFDDGGVISGPLNIREGLSSVPISPGRRLYAEAGHQIVVADIPATIPDGEYEFSLRFSLSSSRPIAVKPIFLGQMTFNGRDTFFPPLFPDAISMSNVPPLVVPLSDTLVEILPALDTIGDASTFVVAYCPKCDQLHLAGEASNVIPIGSTATVSVTTQRQSRGIAVDVIFTKLIGDFEFTSGDMTPNRQATTITTDRDGRGEIRIAPTRSGLAVLKAAVPNTSLAAFYVFYGQ